MVTPREELGELGEEIVPRDHGYVDVNVCELLREALVPPSAVRLMNNKNSPFVCFHGALPVLQSHAHAFDEEADWEAFLPLHLRKSRFARKTDAGQEMRYMPAALSASRDNVKWLLTFEGDIDLEFTPNSCEGRRL